jgi:hypothetical protein
MKDGSRSVCRAKPPIGEFLAMIEQQLSELDPAVLHSAQDRACAAVSAVEGH